MSGVLLTGHGGFEKLVYRSDIGVPELEGDEVLIKVGGAAVNNTDINTRIGWYSKKVKKDTNTGGSAGFGSIDDEDASWSGIPLQFPRIQGADVAGTIVAVGSKVNDDRVGERVLVRTLQERPLSEKGLNCITFGSECDGGFAEYTKTSSEEAFAINSTLTDIELASFPCSYSTAENMICRVGVKEDDVVFIPGASGGVGSAALQLVKLRGAKVIAMCDADKADRIKNLGADKVLVRGDNITEALGHMSVDVVLDMVAGPLFNHHMNILKRGGRYGSVGAIAGPIVEHDVRTLYLKDLSFFGCTFQSKNAFRNLIRYIEKEKIVPMVAKTYPLRNIREAQEDFLAKKFVGKLVLDPTKNDM
ncbi:alcohol dehydrogenase family protein [Candidatus Formimonas warabiya]|uniref:Alcohol dehydrogenase n=1 Tax=Formimonas warabiya TaxID=1761012 RepID=A0A3G1KMQ7_FORW1|nr:alcohol dehydrogenase family protein [Candidatus Formimonas warabiya]ATW23739.1 alcohol dehydrogenase [Candidatus Formimonas warabiya]